MLFAHTDGCAHSQWRPPHSVSSSSSRSSSALAALLEAAQSCGKRAEAPLALIHATRAPRAPRATEAERTSDAAARANNLDQRALINKQGNPRTRFALGAAA